MLKLFSIFLLSAVSLVALAQENQPKHMIMFGNDFSTSWSGSAGKADVDSGLGIDSYDISNGNFQVNYAYRLAPQFQLGINVKNEVKHEEVKAKAGGKIESDDYVTDLVLFGIINLSERMNDAFYIGLGFGKSWHRSRAKDTTDSTVVSAKSDSDMDIYHIAFGKRFNLKSLGIENLTYSPSISYQYGKVNGDLEDSGVNSISEFTLDIIKFDLLF